MISATNVTVKYTKSRNIEPFWSGIYVTCPRGKEPKCKHEVATVLKEYSEEFYGKLQVDNSDEHDDEAAKEEEQDKPKEDNVEDAIAKELAELQDENKPNKDKANTEKQLFEPMEIGCECVIFVRTRKPIDPVDLVTRICNDLINGSRVRRFRFAQRMTPVSSTATANFDGLDRLLNQVAKPVFFHQGKPQTFAIRPSLRNHNAMDKMEIIHRTAKFIITAPINPETTEEGTAEAKQEEKQLTEDTPKNSVDLKNYDKMVLIECYKSSIGMAIVGPEYERDYHRFNLEKIFTTTNQPKTVGTDDASASATTTTITANTETETKN